MRYLSAAQRLSRWCAALTALLCLAVALGNVAAQKPKPAEEEEELVKPKIKPPLRIDEDDGPAGRRIGARPVDLAREAELAKHAAVRDFYRSLAVPHDVVIFTAVRTPQDVHPIPRYVGPRPEFDGKLKVRTLDTPDKPPRDEDVPRKDIKAVEHYEALALRLTDDFLKKVKDDASLPPLEALHVAEKGLAEVVRFHEFAHERGLRTGPGWDLLERELRGRLRGVRLQQLKALADAKDWTGVLDLAAQLTDIYPRDREVAAAIVAVRVRRIVEDLRDDSLDTFVAARQALEQLERQFPDARDHEATKRLRGRLEERAATLLQRARELAKNDPARAVATLRTVENIWPLLPGLPELRQDLRLYKALSVGVPHLPRWVSPAAAATDADRQGVELVFEGLLRPVADAQVGQRYEPMLAAGPPRMVPLGRQFELVRDARWYRAGKELIDEPVTAADVSSTVALYQKWPGSPPQWIDLLGEARAEDPYRLRVSLRQGYLDPLGLMSFKLLPTKHLTTANPADRTFAENPVGSGPYQYLGVKTGVRGIDFGLFLANPTYGSRAGKQELPRIPAIHFYRPRDMVADFKSGELHMMTDVPTPRLKELKPLANVTVQTLRNRRVWFLAVNHHNPRLQNDDFRRALAHAIDREKILTDVFRAGETDARGAPWHRPLNGPYPAGSWACDPSLPKDPFKLLLARTLAKKAAGHAVTLLYPSDVPLAEDACRAIQEQAQAVGLKVDLKAAPLAEVHKAVVRDHQYELAYFHWDHADDTFWLGPLLDARAAGPGGPNFLGPLRDAELENLLTQVRDHRDFAEVQRLTRLIHQRLYQKMPLIPLWQLDTHIAVHRDLKTVPPLPDLDPLLIFTQAEQWRLEK